jgi:uncharacterized protein YdhG (YjbR/CyaY superfamily)
MTLSISTAPPEIQAYFGRLPDDQREALSLLRESIKAVVPEAEEVISYGLPTFKLHGPLVALGAAKKHCAFYHMSSNLLEMMASDLASYDTSKGTIRFTPGQSLPDALVEKIVKLRIQENLDTLSERARRKEERKAAKR